jgi:hypothetical protein
MLCVQLKLTIWKTDKSGIQMDTVINFPSTSFEKKLNIMNVFKTEALVMEINICATK